MIEGKGGGGAPPLFHHPSLQRTIWARRSLSASVAVDVLTRRRGGGGAVQAVGAMGLGAGPLAVTGAMAGAMVGAFGTLTSGFAACSSFVLPSVCNRHPRSAIKVEF